MKVKQTVLFDGTSNIYIGYEGLEFADSHGNQVNVYLTDEQYLDLETRVARKAKSIREARLEKARELMEDCTSNE